MKDGLTGGVSETQKVDTLTVTDDLTVTDTVTFNGVVTHNSTLAVGVDATGYDVEFFGDTTGKSWLWDESADKMIVTGTSTLDGQVTLASASGIVSSVSNGIVPQIVSAGQQALSDAGAVDVTSYYTAWSTTGAAAGTLADGAMTGQLKKVQLIVDGGEGTLTPSNLNGGTTITFADVGDFALLMWDGSGWDVLELNNAADGATAPVLA